jgi:hypothetical protein
VVPVTAACPDRHCSCRHIMWVCRLVGIRSKPTAVYHPSELPLSCCPTAVLPAAAPQCTCCSLPPGQRHAPPLEQPQLAALARLGAKKASDRKAWLEALTAPLAAAASSTPMPVPGAAAEPGEAAGNGIGSSDSSALAGTGVEVSGLLGIVRGRVLPAPHLAYQQPECCYPGSQVRSWAGWLESTGFSGM